VADGITVNGGALAATLVCMYVLLVWWRYQVSHRCETCGYCPLWCACEPEQRPGAASSMVRMGAEAALVLPVAAEAHEPEPEPETQVTEPPPRSPVLDSAWREPSRPTPPRRLGRHRAAPPWQLAAPGRSRHAIGTRSAWPGVGPSGQFGAPRRSLGAPTRRRTHTSVPRRPR